MAAFVYGKKKPNIKMQYDSESGTLIIIVSNHGLETFLENNMVSIIFELRSNLRKIKFGDAVASQDDKALYVEQPRLSGYYLISVDRVRFSAADIVIKIPVTMPMDASPGEYTIWMRKTCEHEAYGIYWDSGNEGEANVFWMDVDSPYCVVKATDNGI